MFLEDGPAVVRCQTLLTHEELTGYTPTSGFLLTARTFDNLGLALDRHDIKNTANEITEGIPVTSSSHFNVNVDLHTGQLNSSMFGSIALSR